MELTEQLKLKVAKYQVSEKALFPIREAPMLFTVGITAAGKNAILRYLLQKYPQRYRFIVSHTTRPMRDYERPDVQYHFVDFPTIEKMIDNGEFIEANIVHADHVYGTAIAEIKKAQDEDKIACSDITIEGVDDYMSLGLNVQAAFLLPPSYEVWRDRLMARYAAEGKGVDWNDHRNRLQSALREIRHGLDTSYYHIIINDDLEETANLVDRMFNGAPAETHEAKSVKIAEEIMQSIREDLKSL